MSIIACVLFSPLLISTFCWRLCISYICLLWCVVYCIIELPYIERLGCLESTKSQQQYIDDMQIVYSFRFFLFLFPFSQHILFWDADDIWHFWLFHYIIHIFYIVGKCWKTFNHERQAPHEMFRYQFQLYYLLDLPEEAVDMREQLIGSSLRRKSHDTI